MALTGAMSAAITGLKAHMDALNVVGNNVANVNTYGYKAGRVTFRESIYSTQSAGAAGTQATGGTNPRQIGYGTSVGTIDLDMATSSLESTGYNLDVAIQGDGFFLVGPKNLDINSMEAVKSLSFSKVGDFRFDADGYLVDGAGNVVYGFMASNGTPDPNNPNLVPGGADEPGVSTDLVPIRLPMKSTDPNTLNDAIYVGVDADGRNIYPDDAGAATVDTVDGCVTLENISIDENGCITGTNKDTGDPVVVGYLALGTVANPNGLLHTDGPYYTAAEAAGDARVFAPNSSVTGNLMNGQIEDPNGGGGGGANVDPNSALAANSEVGLMPGFLEASGTDLATEFSNMIIYQRGYQANTRIITVTDSMLEELVNIKR